MCFNQYTYKTPSFTQARQIPEPRRINDMAALVHVNLLGDAPMDVRSPELTQRTTYLFLFYSGCCFSSPRVRLSL